MFLNGIGLNGVALNPKPCNYILLEHVLLESIPAPSLKDLLLMEPLGPIEDLIHDHDLLWELIDADGVHLYDKFRYEILLDDENQHEHGDLYELLDSDELHLYDSGFEELLSQ